MTARHWVAQEMRTQPSTWQRILSDREVLALQRAVDETIASHVSLFELTREHFDSPVIRSLMESLQASIVDGHGFALVRGLPVEQLTREETVRAYLGLSAWLGVPVSQNGQGHLLGHVIDLGDDPADPATRIYTTSYRQPFHTDSCDIVGLLCLQPSRRGGASAIANSTAVFLELAKQRPDLAAALQQPYVYDRKNEIPEGKEPTYEMPVVHDYKGEISVIYARDFIDAAISRFPDTAKVSPLQLEALDTFDSMVASDKFRLDMDFKSGDIQFLHNHQILHARTDYEDWPDPARKRHLLRIWLSAHQGRALPPHFEERYGPIVEGEIRGGIRVPGVEPAMPLFPG